MIHLHNGPSPPGGQITMMTILRDYCLNVPFSKLMGGLGSFLGERDHKETEWNGFCSKRFKKRIGFMLPRTKKKSLMPTGRMCACVQKFN